MTAGGRAVSPGGRRPPPGQQPEEKMQGQAQAQQAAPPAKSIKDYFRWRLPWWVCFLFGIFLLTKLQLVYNDSPCAVLGTQSPVNMTDVKRAFRHLSMCTHPDRLRGRLRREPTAAESRRGEIIFNRASGAKEELFKVLKSSSKKKIACYEGELELAMLAVLAQVGKGLSSLGVGDYLGLAWDLGKNLVTFENGFFGTVMGVLWLLFVFRSLKQFLMYLWRTGMIRGIVAIVTTVVVGPLPTILHFVALPVVRIAAFVVREVLGIRDAPQAAAAAQVAEQAAGSGAATAAAAVPAAGPGSLPENAPPTYSAAMAAGRGQKAREDLPARNVRQRKKKETDEEKEKKNKDLLTGNSEASGGAAAVVNHGAGPMPESIWKCVVWAHSEPVKARQEAATAVQFDLLLILTKPVIPLFMLISLGQVWNGLFSSVIIGHALRRGVPQMSYEAHHLLCSFFGVVHTLLGVSAQQVEDYANREGKNVLHLAWSWSFKDVLSVMHMCLLGSAVTAMAALGNEPSYAASFAAGISLRIFLAQDSIQQTSVARAAASWIQATLRDFGVSLDTAEEVAAYSGHGIGDCGGGPFRMLFGDGPQARIASLALKIWLMQLPILSTLQWLQRCFQAGRMLGKRNKLTRFVQRLILFVLSAMQCGLIASVELNASNGALVNFWVAMLFGCAGESLMSTYDVRGPIRQIIFLLLFLLI